MAILEPYVVHLERHELGTLTGAESCAVIIALKEGACSYVYLASLISQDHLSLLNAFLEELL